MKFKLTLSTILLLGTIIILNAQSYPPDGWRCKMSIAATLQQPKFPEMVVKNDAIHAIWSDNREGNYRVYYKNQPMLGSPGQARSQFLRLAI
ncbi:MAG: hypothetical protein ABIL39_08520 [candidate division WOR-3 bacterium]